MTGPLVEEIKDDDLSKRLFPELKPLAGVVFGVALTFSFGEISRTTAEWAASPTMMNTAFLVARPAFVLLAWIMFHRTILYKVRNDAVAFAAMILALLSFSVAEFANMGLPIHPDASYYATTPGAHYLAALLWSALGAFFLFLAIAEFRSVRAADSYRSQQTKVACVYYFGLTIAVSLMACFLWTSLTLAFFGAWFALAAAFAASQVMRYRWRKRHPGYRRPDATE
jgi:hypothetical protein